MIKDNDNKISTIKLPEYIQIKDRVISYQHFGEVAPEKFNLFTKYEKKMSNIELEMFSNNWTELVKDNSPLRAVVNGQLIGVPINFYDYLIYKNYKNLGYEPIKEAGLIGNILGYYPVGIRDYWYAYRIEEMIKNKKIEIVEDCEKKYARSIKIR